MDRLLGKGKNGAASPSTAESSTTNSSTSTHDASSGLPPTTLNGSAPSSDRVDGSQREKETPSASSVTLNGSAPPSDQIAGFQQEETPVTPVHPSKRAIPIIDLSPLTDAGVLTPLVKSKGKERATTNKTKGNKRKVDEQTTTGDQTNTRRSKRSRK